MPTFPPSSAFEKIVARLRDDRSYDAALYKRQAVERRISKRGRDLGLASYDEYLARLDEDPDEITALLDALLIGVTSFFRDEEAWDRLRTVEVPRLLEALGPDQAVRVWVAGCATGEEAYSIAMVLSTALGEGAVDRLRVFATDIDDAALATARRARYPAAAFENVPADLREAWVVATPEGDHQVVPLLRGSVVFGHQDLLADTPITRLDLVLCRNVLMYFTAAAQRQLVERFHHALVPDGILVLGRAETLLAHGDLFAPLDTRLRIFSRVTPRAPSRAGRGDPAARPARAAGASVATGRGDGAAALAVERSDAPQLVVDDGHRLVIANRAGRSLLGLAADDIGRPIGELALPGHPALFDDAIAEAARTKGPAVRRAVPVADGQLFDVHAVPLGAQEGPAPVLLSFVDVTDTHRTQAALDEANMALGRAFEEVEAANDELQATVQELETTNEELQASNDELETMNVELAGTNAELSAINAELDRRTGDVERVNAFLGSVIDSLAAAVIVVDVDQRVRAWNRAAVDLWGVPRSEAVGRPLSKLDLRLPMEHVISPVRSVLAGDAPPEPVAVEVDSRLPATVTYAALRGAEGTVEGAIFICTAVSPGGA